MFHKDILLNDVSDILTSLEKHHEKIGFLPMLLCGFLNQCLCFSYIDSTCTIILLMKSKVSSAKLSSVTVQVGLRWTWSETPKTCFLAYHGLCVLV